MNLYRLSCVPLLSLARPRVLALRWIVFLLALTLAAPPGRHEPANVDPAIEIGIATDTPSILEHAAQRLAGVPLPIVENRGQAAADIAFLARGAGRSVDFRADGIVLTLRGESGSESGAGATPGHALHLDFVGGTDVRPIGREAAAGTFQYFRGAAQQWVRSARSYGEVLYPDVWPGISVAFRSCPSELKYEFRLETGADPAAIRLAWRGAGALRIEADGTLAIETPVETVRDAAPVAWQHRAGASTAVDVAWRIDDAGSGGATPTFGFIVGNHDRTRPLVIDPSLLVSSGFLGGAAENFSGPASSADEAITDAVFDSDGDLYVVGWTTSTEASFPTKTGPIRQAAGNRDAFVAKLTDRGTTIEFCSFIGGENRDEAYGVAINRARDVFVCGYTLSDETTFPVVDSPSTTYAGQGDAFLARISADGEFLDHCGYVGTAAIDYATDIAVDAGSSDIFIVGASQGEGLPVRRGPDSTYNGSLDAFVGKIESGNDDFEFLGYLGGTFDDAATSVAIDGDGRAHVVGYTWSNEESFPVLVGPDLTYNHPVSGFTQDAFIARVAAGGDRLEYCGYIGGVGWDTAAGIALDPSGAACVVGTTLSDETSFPVTLGPSLTYSGGVGILGDAFVARVAPAGEALEFCGYVGSSTGDAGYAIALDGDGHAFITGVTYGDDFPVAGNSPGSKFRGNGDAFLARIAPDASLVSSGFIGGAGVDIGNAVAHDGVGTLLVAGSTASDETTLRALGGPAVRHAGGHPDQSAPTDGFLARYTTIEAPQVVVRVTTTTPVVRAGESIEIAIEVENTGGDRARIAGWLEAYRPDGSGFARNPVAGPRTHWIHGATTLVRTVRRTIPDHMPPSGRILLRAMLGSDQDHPTHLASVEIEVIP